MRAKAAHQPVVIFFSAGWCLPCKEMELKTFADASVARALSRFALVKVDCTNDDGASNAAQKRWGVATLPHLLIVGGDGKLARRFDAFVNATQLLPALTATR
jgi:thiol:disulfide interchange protein DsbD